MKLIKTEDEQGVMYSLSGDNLPDNYVLSKQNCDSLFGVVDIEKLANDSFNKKFSKCSEQLGLYDVGFIDGFNKAISLNKDKVFTRDDIEEAFAYGQLNQLHNQKYFSGSKAYLQSLLQQTEIEVAIVMEDSIGIGDKYTPEPKPPLDENGCLILKKI